MLSLSLHRICSSQGHQQFHILNSTDKSFLKILLALSLSLFLPLSFKDIQNCWLLRPSTNIVSLEWIKTYIFFCFSFKFMGGGALDFHHSLTHPLLSPEGSVLAHLLFPYIQIQSLCMKSICMLRFPNPTLTLSILWFPISYNQLYL